MTGSMEDVRTIMMIIIIVLLCSSFLKAASSSSSSSSSPRSYTQSVRAVRPRGVILTERALRMITLEQRQEVMCETCHTIAEALHQGIDAEVRRLARNIPIGDSQTVYIEYRKMIQTVCEEAEVMRASSLPMVAACKDFVAKDGEIMVEAFSSFGQPARGLLRNATESTCRKETNACARDGQNVGARIIPHYHHELSKCELCSVVVRDVNRVARRRNLGNKDALTLKERRAALSEALDTVCTMLIARHSTPLWPSSSENRLTTACDDLVDDNEDDIIDALAALKDDAQVSAESAVCRRKLSMCSHSDEL